MSASLAALRASVLELRGIVEPLDDDAIGRSAYPTDWTIAAVMSHVGSGAVILQRGFDDQLAGITTPDDLAPGVWDEWNAKTPRGQVDDGLAADAALLARLEAASDPQREGFSFAMGPMTFDFEGFVGLRLNEHAFHTWDIAVSLDPSATIPGPIAALVVDNLALIAQYTAQPSADTATIRVRTTEPERRFTVEISSEGSVLAPSTNPKDSPDLELPAEAFVRLIYGRLDEAHTPPFVGDPADLDRLRATFPGP